MNKLFIKFSLLLFLSFMMQSCSGKSPSPDDLDGSLEEGNIPVSDGSAIGGTLNDIRFEYDSYNLNPTLLQVVSNHAQYIKDNSDETYTIEGHCDERGTSEYNLALGSRRAEAVKNALVSYGVNPSSLKTVSFGEELPLDPAHNEMAWEKNRRVHYSFSE